MKTITIENLLSWAFIHELSKGGGVEGIGSPRSAWSALEGVASLGVRIDVQRDRQDLPSFIEQGDPHPDALLVGQAVRDLASFDFACVDIVFADLPLDHWPDDAKSLAVTHFRNVVERIKARSANERGRSLVALVVTHAVLGKSPYSDISVPKVKTIERGGKACWFVKQTRIDCFGKTVEIEIDGYNQKKQRPMKAAYQKQFLSPSPEADIAAYLDFVNWRNALAFLHGRLDGKLAAYRLAPFSGNKNCKDSSFVKSVA